MSKSIVWRGVRKSASGVYAQTHQRPESILHRLNWKICTFSQHTRKKEGRSWIHKSNFRDLQKTLAGEDAESPSGGRAGHPHTQARTGGVRGGPPPCKRSASSADHLYGSAFCAEKTQFEYFAIATSSTFSGWTSPGHASSGHALLFRSSFFAERAVRRLDREISQAAGTFGQPLPRPLPQPATSVMIHARIPTKEGVVSLRGAFRCNMFTTSTCCEHVEVHNMLVVNMQI